MVLIHIVGVLRGSPVPSWLLMGSCNPPGRQSCPDGHIWSHQGLDSRPHRLAAPSSFHFLPQAPFLHPCDPTISFLSSGFSGPHRPTGTSWSPGTSGQTCPHDSLVPEFGVCLGVGESSVHPSPLLAPLLCGNSILLFFFLSRGKLGMPGLWATGAPQGPPDLQENMAFRVLKAVRVPR